MPCYFPLTGIRSPFPGPNGKFRITDIKARTRREVTPPGVALVEFPCGRCFGCRLEYSRKWAIRCVHEASVYPSNCFITLTYSDEHLPAWGDLDKSAFPKFMKRLRKHYNLYTDSDKGVTGVRYFHCGEYGDRLGRPHYHACLFNFDFSDRVLFKKSDAGNLYTSAELARLWPFGFCTVGDVTFDSAAYVARYVMKKINGDDAKEHYTVLDPLTGELHEKVSEYVTMSRRPGIGRLFFDRFASDVYPDDFVITNGFKVKPPRYYDSLYEIDEPEVMKSIREARAVAGYVRRDDATLSRLDVRRQVALAKFKLSKRSLDDDV